MVDFSLPVLLANIRHALVTAVTNSTRARVCVWTGRRICILPSYTGFFSDYTHSAINPLPSGNTVLMTGLRNFRPQPRESAVLNMDAWPAIQ